MKDQYVILTGSKNNAGDFLIKYRAKQLFSKFRQDRKIVDFNSWEKFDDEKLEIVNNSKALILLGGPALQKNMYPDIYKMYHDLDQIKVPVIMMGLGWKDIQGDWEKTYHYKLSEMSLKLIEKINDSGYDSSLRDYHTHNVLQNKGYKKNLMTGCPAYYDINYIDKQPKQYSVKKVAFSVGVAFVHSPSMQVLMKEVISQLRKKYENFEVVFHHSVDTSKLKEAYKHRAVDSFSKKHNELIEWLEENNISYVDISGSAENLIKYYTKVDLHIGYRVHAHIFMNSISKYSILLNEDGRGKAVHKVLNGTTIDAYKRYREGFFLRLLNKFYNVDRFVTNPSLSQELGDILDTKEEEKYKNLVKYRQRIDTNFKTMKFFLENLP